MIVSNDPHDLPFLSPKRKAWIQLVASELRGARDCTFLGIGWIHDDDLQVGEGGEHEGFGVDKLAWLISYTNYAEIINAACSLQLSPPPTK